MKLTLRETMEGWYCIERAEHEGKQWLEKHGPNSFGFQCSERISDADVEGHASEMLEIAEAIETGGESYSKRCAVKVKGGTVEFWSPRNSQRHGEVPLSDALALAAEIRQKLGPKTEQASA